MARIVFDLDGTLIDSAPDIHGIANALLAVENEPPITIEQTRSFIGNGVGVFVEKLRKLRGMPETGAQNMVADFVAAYDEAVHLTRPYPDVLNVLAILKERGHVLGICTNKPIRPCRAVLKHLQMNGFFDVVVGGDSFATRKPDPEPLISAFNVLKKGTAIYVGDSEVDAETAQSAKVPFLLFSEGYRKTPVKAIPHNQSFDQFLKLPELVDGLVE